MLCNQRIWAALRAAGLAFVEAIFGRDHSYYREFDKQAADSWESSGLWKAAAKGKWNVGGQGIERREILRYIGIASVAGTFPGFQRWAFACAHEPPVAAIGQATSRTYKPLFFSPAHYAMVERLTEIVIPADDTPGAKEAGVAEFIDFMVANRVPISSSEDVRTVEETHPIQPFHKSRLRRASL